MMLVLIMAGVLWGIGALMGAPRRARWTMVAVLMIGVFIAQIALPLGHPLKEATGGDVRLWLLILAFVGLFVGYRALLRMLKRRAVLQPQAQGNAPTFSDAELERYARHIVLREVGGTGQKALKNAKVLVVGAGGLGSPVLQYLAAAGVGTIGVIDDDIVENTNLQRQIIHMDRAIGSPKVQSAADMMLAQNPFVTVRPYQRRLTAEIAETLFADFDLIIDGCDNFETRHLVNVTATHLGKPLISGAISQWEGQLSVFHPAAGTPCYACVFPTAPDPALVPNCAEGGVIGPLPGVIGTMMAIEAIKHITKAGDTLAGHLMIYDALYAQTRRITITRNPDCAVCQTGENT